MVLEARGSGGLDCTRRLKRDQKEALALQEISTYTSLRVYMPRPGDTCTGPPTHTRLFCQVPRLPRNTGEDRLQRGRDVVWRLETRVKPSSLIGSLRYGERKTPWLVPLGSTRLTPALLPRPMLVEGGNEFGARKERKPRERSDTDLHRQGSRGQRSGRKNLRRMYFRISSNKKPPLLRLCSSCMSPECLIRQHRQQTDQGRYNLIRRAWKIFPCTLN